jgi:16S rRNA (cytidine1402-2'-O)-methyltransferase
MKIQKSFEKNQRGAIYLVPTPIGNLEDITYRALNILKNADLIAAEDTRNTRKLMTHFEITQPLTSYHEHNKHEKTDTIISKAKAGALIALVSDAGMPAISDPGAELVQEAIKQDVNVVVLPGANAALSALVGSGLNTDEFYFYGFLPRKKKDKEEALDHLKKIKATVIFYESPFRVKDTLKVMRDRLGNRKVTLARELTKLFEEYIRGTLDEVIEWAEESELKGEFVLVVEGAVDGEEKETDTWWLSFTMKEHVDYYIEQHSHSSKDAIKKTALDRNLPKREIYQAYHIGKKEK